MAPRLANRSEKRKNATEREKARMVAISRDIDHIQSLVCPEMNQPTKSKVLRVAVDRLNYLENLFAKLQQMENDQVGNQVLGNPEVGNMSLGNQPLHSQPLQIPGRQRATQMVQNSSIGPSSPNSFDSSADYYPVDYSNQSYPDEASDLNLSTPSNYFHQPIDQIQIPTYQPFQSSYEQANDQPNCWQQAAVGEQHESVADNFLQLENNGDTLQSQADNFFQQFENEIQNCL